MEFQNIKKKHWGPFFDLISEMAKGNWVQLEVVGQEIGVQIERQWVLFEGASYDPTADTVFFHARAHEHAINHPKDVINHENGSFRSITIRDEDGQIQIIHFRDPVLLPV
jgi:hypothetical protein